MADATPTPTAGPAPAAAEPTAADPATPPAQPNGGEQFKSEESKQAVLADLKKEREARQALEAKVTQFESTTAERNKALAQALGLAEEPKNEDDLAETVKAIQERLNASEREATKLRIAAEKNIPAEYHDLLTETDPEKLSAQAEKVGALVAAQQSAAQPPAYQPNPGQGRASSPSPGDDDSYPSHWLPKQRETN